MRWGSTYRTFQLTLFNFLTSCREPVCKQEDLLKRTFRGVMCKLQADRMWQSKGRRRLTYRRWSNVAQYCTITKPVYHTSLTPECSGSSVSAKRYRPTVTIDEQLRYHIATRPSLLFYLFIYYYYLNQEHSIYIIISLIITIIITLTISNAP